LEQMGDENVLHLVNFIRGSKRGFTREHGRRVRGVVRASLEDSLMTEQE
jgi:hypothetical protein